MALNIGIGYKDKFTSDSLNYKFKNIIDDSNFVVSGFDIVPNTGLNIKITSLGKAVVNGVIIENLEHTMIVPSNTSGFDILLSVVLEYKHKLSEVYYSLLTVSEFNAIEDYSNILVLGTINSRNGATEILSGDITNSVKRILDLKTIKDTYTENTDLLLIPSKDLIEQINATKLNARNLIQMDTEVANLKLYQAAGDRLVGTNLVLFGTDFVVDLETTRLDSNTIANGQTKDIRIGIDTLIAKESISVIVNCTKATNLTYTAYASIVGLIDTESYFELSLDNSVDFGDGTQELVYTGIVPDPKLKISFKLNVVNNSGSIATVYKVLGALE